MTTTTIVAGWEPKLRKQCGAQTDGAAKLVVEQLTNLLPRRPPEDVATTLALVSAFLVELSPRNVVEAMLATKLVGLHQAAVWCLTRAAAGQGTDAHQEALVSRAVTLTAAFAEQAESWRQLRAKPRSASTRRAKQR